MLGGDFAHRSDCFGLGLVFTGRRRNDPDFYMWALRRVFQELYVCPPYRRSIRGTRARARATTTCAAAHPRTDVDVCFNGDIAVSQVKLL